MAAPVPITGGTVIAATTFFNLGIQGWTESYFIHVNGGTNAIQSAEECHQRVIDLRRPILPQDVIQAAQRYSDVAMFGDSDLIFPPANNLGPGGNVVQAGYPAIGWLATVSDASFNITDVRIFRGWSPAQAPYDSTSGPGAAPPAAVAAWFLAMKAILNTGTTFSGGVCRYVLRSFVRPGGDPGVILANLSNFALDTNGRLQFRVSNSELGTTFIGDNYKVRVPRKKCLKGASGSHVVVNLEAGPASTTTVTVDKRLCCGASELAGLTGQGFVERQAFYPIAWFDVNRVAKRDTGRAFFATRGRQSARCC